MLTFFPHFLTGHRFEDVPGVRRHLVTKSAKGQVVHIGKDHKELSSRVRTKLDRTPHEVRPAADLQTFVSINAYYADNITIRCSMIPRAREGKKQCCGSLDYHGMNKGEISLLLAH